MVRRRRRRRVEGEAKEDDGNDGQESQPEPARQTRVVETWATGTDRGAEAKPVAGSRGFLGSRIPGSSADLTPDPLVQGQVETGEGMPGAGLRELRRRGSARGPCRLRRKRSAMPRLNSTGSVSSCLAQCVPSRLLPCARPGRLLVVPGGARGGHGGVVAMNASRVELFRQPHGPQGDDGLPNLPMATACSAHSSRPGDDGPPPADGDRRGWPCAEVWKRTSWGNTQRRRRGDGRLHAPPQLHQ